MSNKLVLLNKLNIKNIKIINSNTNTHTNTNNSNVTYTDDTSINIDEIIKSNKNTKNAVILLTRGYIDIRKYEMLINRNKSIEKNLIDKSIDILIFNENNITIEHQNHIKKITPNLNIIFISILEKAFLNEKKNIIVDKSVEKCSLGYRHMCSFWFVNFWNFVKNYDRVLRIDEDCIIDFNIDNIFYLLNDKVAIYGHWERDCEFVTNGLNNFTINFLNNNNITNNNISRIISGPYTNIISFNLEKLRQNEILFKYINEIDKSNNIYIWRWGDLPLWGEVLSYFYNKEDHLLTKYIKYYHKSHNRKVNN
jgi:hypothetical protein